MVQRCRICGFLVVRNYKRKSLSAFESARGQTQRLTSIVFYIFATIGTPVLLLQLYNTVFLGAFWPFFTGIVFQLIAAVFQFARMILLLPE